MKTGTSYLESKIRHYKYGGTIKFFLWYIMRKEGSETFSRTEQQETVNDLHNEIVSFFRTTGIRSDSKYIKLTKSYNRQDIEKMKLTNGKTRIQKKKYGFQIIP